MPRTRKTSEKEEEIKPVRKTRQTVLISDSPVRRSTRIKHVVDSSPESEKSITSKREFRKKNPNPDKYPTPGRVLRNRSPSNDIENSPQATRKLRKRASPEITNIGDSTTRSTRYSRRNKLSESEDQSPPPPVTRKTRGKSVADEDDSVSKKKASSKSRKRVMSVPVEASLLEEDKTDYDETLEKSIVEETDDSIIIVDEINSIKSVVKKKEKVHAMEKNLMKRLMSHKLNFSSNDSQQELKKDSSIKKETSLIDLDLSKNEDKDKTVEEEYFCEPMEVDTSILNAMNDAATKNQNVDNSEKIEVPERMDRNFKPRNSMIESGSEKHLITKSRYSLGNKIPNKIVIDEIKNRRQEEKNKKSLRSTENLESKSDEKDENISSKRESSEKRLSTEKRKSLKSTENLESKSDEKDENISSKRESSEKRLSIEKRKSILNNSVKNSLSKSPSFHLLVTPDKEEFLKSNKEEISKSTEKNLLKSHEKINRKRKRRSSDDYDTSNNDFELTMYEYDSPEERVNSPSHSNKNKPNTILEEEIIPDSEEEEKEKEPDSKFLDNILKRSKSKSLSGSEIVSKKTRGFKSLDRMSLETLNSFDGKREISEGKKNNLNKSKVESGENSLLSEEISSGEETVEFVKNTRKSQGDSKTPTPKKRLSNVESAKDEKSLLPDEEESSGEETMETVKSTRKSQGDKKTPTAKKRLSNLESAKDEKSLLPDEEEYSGDETMETVKSTRKSQGDKKTSLAKKRLSNLESAKDGKSLLLDEEESSGDETMETVKSTRKSQGDKKTSSVKKRLSNLESAKDGNSLLSDGEESSDQETMETVKNIRKSQNKTPTPKKRSSNVESSRKSSSRGKLDETGDSVSRIPTFMFSQTSESEETGEDASRSIDSDIAREYNLSGKSNLKYSDDDVPGDNCRDSETERSDSEDEGSDLADFIADDDEEEESEDSETEHYEEVDVNESKKGAEKVEIVDEEDEEKESDDDDEEEDDDEKEARPEEVDNKEVDNKEGDNEESDDEEDDNEESEEVNNKEADDDDESEESVFADDLKSSLQLYKSKLTKKGKDDEKEVEKEKRNISLENKEEKVSKSKSKKENEEEEIDEETSSDEAETTNKKNLLLSSPVLSKSRSDRSLSDEEEKTKKHKESPNLEKSLVEPKRKKKNKRELKSTASKVPVASSTHYELSDADDEEPETLSFAEGLLRAADEMKKKAQSIKEGIKGKEDRKKKKKSNEDNIRKTKSDEMKRLPDDVLQDLEDVPRPNKRQKMLKKENIDSPSRGTQQPRPGPSTRRPTINSVSSFGSTTEFEIVNLQKEKKQKTQSSLAMKWFKQRMLARNARQPISVYLNQQKKRRAANKEYHSN